MLVVVCGCCKASLTSLLKSYQNRTRAFLALRVFNAKVKIEPTCCISDISKFFVPVETSGKNCKRNSRKRKRKEKREIKELKKTTEYSKKK